MVLVAVVGTAYLLDKEIPPSSDLSRVSKSSSVADECKREVRERLRNSIDEDANRKRWRSSYQEERKEIT